MRRRREPRQAYRMSLRSATGCPEVLASGGRRGCRREFRPIFRPIVCTLLFETCRQRECPLEGKSKLGGRRRRCSWMSGWIGAGHLRLRAGLNLAGRFCLRADRQLGQRRRLPGAPRVAGGLARSARSHHCLSTLLCESILWDRGPAGQGRGSTSLRRADCYSSSRRKRLAPRTHHDRVFSLSWREPAEVS
jgi:hypothetical protein